MYRVFEALDELVTIVEEARSVPMTAGCVVPRGDVLELLDEIRDAIPTELDDAQDVLDQRDEVVNKAKQEAEQSVSSATEEAERMRSEAESESHRVVSDAQAHAEDLLAQAQAEAERTVSSGRAEYEDLLARGQSESDRMVDAGRAAYERSVQDGRAEQARLVSETDVVRAAHSESARIVDAANDEADKVRSECDVYVDGKLGEFEDMLASTLRTIGNGRTHLRGSAPSRSGPAPFDYSQA